MHFSLSSSGCWAWCFSYGCGQTNTHFCSNSCSVGISVPSRFSGSLLPRQVPQLESPLFPVPPACRGCFLRREQVLGRMLLLRSLDRTAGEKHILLLPGHLEKKRCPPYTKPAVGVIHQVLNQREGTARFPPTVPAIDSGEHHPHIAKHGMTKSPRKITIAFKNYFYITSSKPVEIKRKLSWSTDSFCCWEDICPEATVWSMYCRIGCGLFPWTECAAFSC